MSQAHLNIVSPVPRRVEIDPAVLARMAQAAILYYDALDTSRPELRLIDAADLRAIELASLLKNL